MAKNPLETGMNVDLIGRIRRFFGNISTEVFVYDPGVVHRVSESFHITDPATGRVQTYSDRNEIPESLRQALDQAELSPGESGGRPTTRVETHHEFHVADGDGSVRVYHSLDEMPPGIRRFFE